MTDEQEYAMNGAETADAPAGRTMHVYAATHPLRAQRDLHQVPEGCTVKEIVDAVDPHGTMRSHFVVHVGGEVVPRDVWQFIKPKANTSIAIRAVPMGGDDKDPLRTILTVVVVVAAAWVGAGAGGFFTSQTSASIAAAATPRCGSLSINRMHINDCA